MKKLNVLEGKLKEQKSAMQAKAKSNKDLLPFLDKAKESLSALSKFLEDASDKVYEADYVGDDEKKAKELLTSVEAFVACAEHHQVGAEASKKRQAALLS